MFAKVIVDIASSQVDKIFDYENTENIGVGRRVLVPFGNRKLQGIIVDNVETTDVPNDKIKPICKAMEDNPVISPEQMELTKMMCEKYRLGLSDVFRLFLPSVIKRGRAKPLYVAYIVLKDRHRAYHYQKTVRRNAPLQTEAVNYFVAHEEANKIDANKMFSSVVINKLIKRGILGIEKRHQNRTPLCLESETKNFKLSDEQKNVISQVTEPKAYLLHGVTGSGKTEVYMRLVEKELKEGKSAIFLVPEIALTPQMLSQFKGRFGNRIAILHSGLSLGEKFDEWQRIRNGEADVVLGARSAIFAPVENLGIIIVDEEHEQSYVSETNPRYSAIEVAEMMAKINKCKLILGSATPSLESYHKAMTGEFFLLEMKKRINGEDLPPIEIVDMQRERKNGNTDLFSLSLQDAIKTTLEKKRTSHDIFEPPRLFIFHNVQRMWLGGKMSFV